MSSERQVARVRAAQDGNQQAQDTLVSEYLPLVYNIVGRALNGHADVDDVVQETMIRVLGGLDGLRDPENFRSWLVAITMNQIRGHWRERATGAIPGGGGLGDGYDVVDPGADFVDLTITRLGLSGQRRETAEATRWLDEDDRALLSLWWLEAAGELTRAEVAEALELSPQHAAVRVQRMKAQLETSRVVVRALATEPRCAGLQQIASGWDGVPSALWRKRLARHARDCAVCTDHWSNLVPAERLLVALALVPVGAALTGAVTRPGLVTVGFAEDAPLSARVLARRARAKRQRRTAGVAAAVAAVAALVAGGAAVHLLTGPEEDESARATAAAPAESAAAKTAKSASPSAQRSASPSAKPSPGKSESKDKGETKEKEKAGDKATKKPKLSPTPTKAPPKPKPEASAPQVPSGAADQVISLVNAERAKAGCGPVRANSQLATAATRHSADMDARDYFDHTSPDGTDPGDRITAAGYRWSTYGENIARGQQTPAAVMDSWMNSSGHRANILNCDFKELGIGIHRASGGPWWTQAFGASR